MYIKRNSPFLGKEGLTPCKIARHPHCTYLSVCGELSAILDQGHSGAQGEDAKLRSPRSRWRRGGVKFVAKHKQHSLSNHMS